MVCSGNSCCGDVLIGDRMIIHEDIGSFDVENALGSSCVPFDFLSAKLKGYGERGGLRYVTVPNIIKGILDGTTC